MTYNAYLFTAFCSAAHRLIRDHQRLTTPLLFTVMTAVFLADIRPVLAQTDASSSELVVEASTSLEWDQNKGAYKAVGNASASQGSQKISADTLTATYDPASGTQDINRIIGEGNVRFSDQQQQGQGQKLNYDKAAESYLLDGPKAFITGPDGQASADKSIYYEKAKGMITLEDNAIVILNDGRELAGEFVTITLDDMQNVSSIKATGKVVVKQPNGQVATSDSATYDKLANAAQFFGNVVITEQESVLTGEKAEIDFTSGISRMLSPSKGKRISGRFTTTQK